MDDLPQQLAKLLQVRAAGGQMPDIPVPQGVPEGFLNPAPLQRSQYDPNVQPLNIGVDIPAGNGRVTLDAYGANVAAPGFNETKVNALGLGYQHPVAGGLLSGRVIKNTQQPNYNFMLNYMKQF